MSESTEVARVGLISDTHGLLRPEVFDVFAGVDRILHAGDVGDPDILTELGAIGPVSAVWGNVDFDLRSSLSEIVELQIGGVAVGVLHGHQLGSPTPARLAERLPKAGMVVFGHTHQPLVERIGTVLATNPGSAGPRRFNLPVTVGIATFERGQVTVDLVPLDR